MQYLHVTQRKIYKKTAQKSDSNLNDFLFIEQKARVQIRLNTRSTEANLKAARLYWHPNWAVRSTIRCYTRFHRATYFIKKNLESHYQPTKKHSEGANKSFWLTWKLFVHSFDMTENAWFTFHLIRTSNCCHQSFNRSYKLGIYNGTIRPWMYLVTKKYHLNLVLTMSQYDDYE